MPRRLAVVAGAGALAPQVIEAALSAGDVVRAFTLSPLELPAGAEQVDASVGELEVLLKSIRAFGATHLTLAGAVSLSDMDRQRIAAALGGAAASQGDAALSHLGERLREITGAELLGAHEIVPDLLAPAGTIAGPPRDARWLAAARLALAAARQVGSMDLGQAAVVAGQRVVAAEDVAGTDDLLARVAKYRATGLIGDSADAPVVLGKASKPRQPLFVDLPAVGPRTIEGAAEAGVGLIAVEAGRTLLLDKPQLIQLADAHGVGIVGLRTDA